MVSLDRRLIRTVLPAGTMSPGPQAVGRPGRRSPPFEPHRVGVVERLALDAHVLAGVDELPAPLEGVDVDLTAGWGATSSTAFSVTTVKPNRTSTMMMGMIV